MDTSATSPNALANATLLGSLRGELTPGTTIPGGYAFIFTPTTPYTITTGTGSVGIDVYLVTPDVGDYSTTACGRFTASAPTVGSADGYVWNDADLDGTFTGSEQTRFGMTNANVRLALTGSLLHLNSYSRNGTTVTLTIDSYAGNNYQLQRATSLTAGNWTNIGDAQAGSDGTALTFTDSDGTDPAAFYRVAVVPPAANAGTQTKVTAASQPIKPTRVVNDSSR